MEYRRKQYATVMDRLNEPRKFMQVIAGPRQVGKTTLINQVLKDIIIPNSIEVADNVNPNDTDWIRRIWESNRTKMAIHKETERLLVIDEIQKIDNWSEAVKKEWDSDTRNNINLKVIILGSSRLLLKHGLTESLAGRFELIRLGHWTLEEMQIAFGFTLDEYIYFGGYPGTAHMIKNERRWKNYIKRALIAPAIDNDVILTSNIYKPALMRQLFELGCSYSAMILSLTKLMGQLQDAGNVTTLAGYLEILQESELLTTFHKYAIDNARKYNSIPKYQVYNNALMTAYKGTTFEKIRTNPQVWGRWVESAIGAHLLTMAEELDYKVYYWRDGCDEVDFIVERFEKRIAIEVKSGKKKEGQGYLKFLKTFKPEMSLIVGSESLTIEDFLKSDLEEIIG